MINNNKNVNNIKNIIETREKFMYSLSFVTAVLEDKSLMKKILYEEEIQHLLLCFDDEDWIYELNSFSQNRCEYAERLKLQATWKE